MAKLDDVASHIAHESIGGEGTAINVGIIQMIADALIEIISACQESARGQFTSAGFLDRAKDARPVHIRRTRRGLRKRGMSWREANDVAHGMKEYAEQKATPEEIDEILAEEDNPYLWA